MGKRPDAFGLDVRPDNASSQGHRGGSSLHFEAAHDLQHRVQSFRQGLQKLTALARLSGPLAQFLLSAKFELETKPIMVEVSRSVSVGLIDRGTSQDCEVYDYRNGTTLSIDNSHFDVVAEAIHRRKFDAKEFIKSGAMFKRIDVLQFLGEAGFLRVSNC
jgi:hypothetical protein